MGFLQKCKICKQKKECNKSICRDCTADSGKNPNKKSFTPKFTKSGQLELFMSLWMIRPHKSYINDEVIHDFNIQCFAHVLPKGSYPRYELNPDNIVFMTPDQHHRQHSEARSILEAEHPGWVKFFQLQDMLKLKYNTENE